MAMARGASGMRCGRFIFIFSPGIDQTARVEIKFGPFRRAKLAGADEGESGQFKRGSCFRRALIGRNGAQNPAERFWLDDGSAMLDCWRDQGALEGARRIGLGASGGDGVAEDLPDGRAESARRFMPAARLDSAKDAQNFRRGYLGDWAHADGGPGEA